MRRRTILAALCTTTVSLAGCTGGSGGSPADGREDSDGDEDGGDGDDDGGNGDEGAENGSENGSEIGSVVDQFDGGPTRPECEREPETVEAVHGDDTEERETAGTIPYPEPPTGLDDADGKTVVGDDADGETVVEFVGEFEHAYLTHDVLCDRQGSGHILRISYSVQESETFDWYDDIEIVCLLQAGGATAGLDEDGYEWVTDLPHTGVVYAVDGTGIARVDFDDAARMEPKEWEAEAPDPLEDGELVATFD